MIDMIDDQGPTLTEAIDRLAAVIERLAVIYEKQLAYAVQALAEHEGVHQTKPSDKLE